MIAYYNRTTGETSDNYTLAKRWHNLGQHVFTYNFKFNKVFDWRSQSIRKIEKR